MIFKLKGFLLMSWFLLGAPVVNCAVAQSFDFKFTHLTAHDGLSSNTVSSIQKDHYGFMWFATLEGLNKYDGKDFKVYRFSTRNNSKFESREIRVVYEDKAFRIWVGTVGGGLFLYNRQLDIFESVQGKGWAGVSLQPHINTIVSDHTGKVWVGTLGGLYSVDPNTRTVSDSSSGIGPSARIGEVNTLNIFEDSRRRLWVATLKGLYLFDKNRKLLHVFRHSNNDSSSIACDSVSAIAEDSKGRIWVGTFNGLNLLSSEGRTLHVFKNRLNDESSICGDLIYAISPVGSDKLFIGSEGGLSQLDINTLSIIRLQHNGRNPFSVGSRSVRALYIDTSGICWVGTYEGGIYKYDANLTLFNIIRNNEFDPHGLSAPFVTSFAESTNGDIFVGTDGGGLNLFNKTNRLIRRVALGEGKVSAHLPILSMIVDRKSRLWIGTFQRGLYMLDQASGNVKHFNAGVGPDKIIENNIFCLKEDSRGRIWIGTNGSGVNIYDPVKKTFSVISPDHDNATAKKLPVNGYIRAIEEDVYGNIWIASHGDGIAVYNPELRTYRVINFATTGLPLKRIFSLLSDRDGNIWIGTGGDGLFLYNLHSKKIRVFLERDGLPDGVIHKILQDKQGKIWVSTNKGICTFDPRYGKFTTYSQFNGLQNEAFMNGAGLVDKRGTVFFGGLEGFNYIDPSDVKINANPPPVILTGLSVDNSAVNPGKGSPLLENIATANEINLDYRHDFSISYVALNYTLSNHNRYAYKLDGFDRNWKKVGATTVANYTNLDPGEYTFKVIASNNDGLWNHAGTAIRIIIRPPFWRTYWAYGFLLFLFAGSIFLIRKKGIEKIEKRHRDSRKKEEEERVRELDMMKINFLTNLSHDFRTPVSLIIAPVEKLLKQQQSELIAGQLEIIKKNSLRLMRLVNQLTDFRKIEGQQMKLEIRPAEISAFITDIAAAFKDLSESKKIKFVVHNVESKLFLKFDQDKLERVMFNLLFNAFKFTLEGGTVTIAAKLLSDNSVPHVSNLEIRVSDTGKGILPEKRDLVFERFYQAETPVAVAGGLGLGLSIAREFVQLHGGQISVESEINRGTDFIVVLPLRHAEDSLIPLSVPVIETCQNKPLTAVKSTTPRSDDQQKILIVEDNKELRSYLKENLSETYTVFEAADGKDGWEKALSCHPELIISDIDMPFLDGISLSRKLKTDKRTGQIPVILLTGLDTPEDELRGLEAGANDYLTKPFDYERLSVKIKNLLSQNRLFKETYSKQIQVSPSGPEINSSNEKFINNLVLYIEDNLNNPKFSVEDMSRRFDMSRGTLYNRLNEITGLSPVDFVRSIKLQRAAELLKKSDLTISQIAYTSGFGTPHYFTKAFKAKYNILPSDYKQLFRNAVYTDHDYTENKQIENEV